MGRGRGGRAALPAIPVAQEEVVDIKADAVGNEVVISVEMITKAGESETRALIWVAPDVADQIADALRDASTRARRSR